MFVTTEKFIMLADIEFYFTLIKFIILAYHIIWWK